MRYMCVSVLCLLLASCASEPTRNSHYTPTVDYFVMADNAIEKKDWETAYRFLEDKLISQNQTEQAKAITTILSNPNVLNAAANSFTYDQIKSSMMKYGDEKGIEWERKRLSMFRVVALNTQFESAKSNIDAADRTITHRTPKTEEPKKVETLAESLERERIRIIEELLSAKKKSVIICKTKRECEKIFSLTQIYVSSAADMKIQLATDTIIETYNPTSVTSVGIKAIKAPRKGESHEISMTVSCADDKGYFLAREFCVKKSIEIYKKFPLFIANNLAQ